jgi:hypothetical protein
MNAGIQGNLTGPAGPSAQPRGEGTLQQSADWFTPIPSRSAELVEQLRLRPGGLAPSIPIGKHVQRLFVIEREASRDPAADAERMDVAMLPFDGRRHHCHVALRSRDDQLGGFTKNLRPKLSRDSRRYV